MNQEIPDWEFQVAGIRLRKRTEQEMKAYWDGFKAGMNMVFSNIKGMTCLTNLDNVKAMAGVTIELAMKMQKEQNGAEIYHTETPREGPEPV